MKRIINATEITINILRTNPETRNDDCLLWLKVIEKVAELNDMADFSRSLTLASFLSTTKYTKFPPYHTVSRIRRKAQEKYPELRATEETQAARAELEEEYREFAQNY